MVSGERRVEKGERRAESEYMQVKLYYRAVHVSLSCSPEYKDNKLAT